MNNVTFSHACKRLFPTLLSDVVHNRAYTRSFVRFFTETSFLLKKEHFDKKVTPKYIFCSGDDIKELLKTLMPDQKEKNVTEESLKRKKIVNAVTDKLVFRSLSENTVHPRMVTAVEELRKREGLDTTSFYDAQTNDFLNQIEKVVKEIFRSNNTTQ